MAPGTHSRSRVVSLLDGVLSLLDALETRLGDPIPWSQPRSELADLAAALSAVAQRADLETLPLQPLVQRLEELTLQVAEHAAAAAEAHQLTQEASGKVRHLLPLTREREDARQQAVQQVQRLTDGNRRLADALRTTKGEIAKLRGEVQKLKAPPFPYGIYIGPSIDEAMAIIAVEGREYEVQLANQDLSLDSLEPGRRVLLNGAYNIVDTRGYPPVGQVAKVVNLLGDGRLLIKSRENEDRVGRLSHRLRKERLRIGDNVLYDDRSSLVLEIMPKSEVEDIVLEEVPRVAYEDIGGLDEQIDRIKDSIELPYVYGYLYREYHLEPPKGILLYGPPGCGKTLVAKAVAANLAQRVNRNLGDISEGIQLLAELRDEVQLGAVLDRFEALKGRIYDVEEIYAGRQCDDPEELLEKLNRSGVLGDFLRRTEGRFLQEQWIDLLVDLKKMGYEGLSEGEVGRLLEAKRRKYLMKKRKTSDREYVMNWLSGYLLNSGVDLDDLEGERERTRARLGTDVESYFLNVKGPELLNKYVGETEFKIREVFNKAKEKAAFGVPVIVFFDEMESLFRTRGSGISSDVESTIVPQFLSEIDGVEKLENVIVIGASNRQDLIDPAVLRPGRLDIKIKIDRPGPEAARDIFSKYLTPDVPIHSEESEGADGDAQGAVNAMIETAVEEMYATKKENEFLRVTYKSGEQETLYFKDFASGAMIAGIVRRAKKMAVKRTILRGVRGVRRQDLLNAIRREYKENEDLPNTTNPDDWSRISGKKGERIVRIQTLMPEKLDRPAEAEEIAVSSRYL